MMTTTQPAARCDHRGLFAVRVGPYQIHAGALYRMTPQDFAGYDLLVPLSVDLPIQYEFGAHYRILAATLPDHSGVHPAWRNLVDDLVAELARGRKVCAFCLASHGRTGCLLASLIAILENRDETPDPIAAVRARHCAYAVETLEQAEAIYALRGESLPDHYVSEFSTPYFH
jgi:hypothetical protein